MKQRLILIAITFVLLSFFCVGCSALSLEQTSTEITGLSTISYPQPANITEAKVTRVIDGDTIEVNIDNKTYTVRYIGIDSPEVNQPYYVEATNKNKELVEGKVVHLEKDVSETDQYGRLLRYVYVGNLLVNGEMVRYGYAESKAYPPDTKYQVTLNKLQLEAKNAERGIWLSDFPTTSTSKPTINTEITTPPPRD